MPRLNGRPCGRLARRLYVWLMEETSILQAPSDAFHCIAACRLVFTTLWDCWYPGRFVLEGQPTGPLFDEPQPYSHAPGCVHSKPHTSCCRLQHAPTRQSRPSSLHSCSFIRLLIFLSVRPCVCTCVVLDTLAICQDRADPALPFADKRCLHNRKAPSTEKNLS